MEVDRYMELVLENFSRTCVLKDMGTPTRVINVRDGESVSWAISRGIYVPVHRPSPWGNPFTHKLETTAQWRVATRAEAIARYEIWLRNQPELLRQIESLRGKVLGCWCAPLPCHGKLLARWADCGIPAELQGTLF